MKHPKIESEPAIFSQNSDTSGVSKNMWPRLEQLIQEAESIGRQANAMIGSLMSPPKKASMAIICYEKLKGTGFYALACGAGQPTGDPKQAQRYCTWFWSSIRAALYDQFSRFVVPDEETREKILEAAVDEQKSEARDAFWRADPTEFKNKIGRIWFLVALANVLGETERRKGQTPVNLDWVFKRVHNVLSQLLPEDDIQNLKYWHGSNQPSRFDKVRLFAVWRLLNRFQDKIFPESERAKFEVPDDEGLVQRLGLMLSRGAESALGVEISQLLRVLFGRYLNVSPTHIEWEESLREGVRYVLGRQNKVDGSWELPMPESHASLFLHRFSPLLHILDLDTELLRLEGASLVEACTRALASARRTLSVQEAALLRGLNDPEHLDWKSLVNSIAVGLSLGATIYDRLKDLLSDLILRHRNAEEGHTEQQVEHIPNSLRFQENIEHGVIRPWLEYDSRRPGAILIYGPPGTGKTTVARIIASELNRRSVGQRVGPIGTDRWRFLSLSAADFAREGSDGIVACAERLFGELKRVRRCVVLLDEMEEFLRARGMGSDRDSRLVTTAFLPLLQEAVKAREVILVVATNFVRSIDVAVTRQGRFDLILPLGPPDPKAREDILKDIREYQHIMDFLKKGKLLNSGEEFKNAVVEYSMGYTRTELESFFLQMWENIKEETQNQKSLKVLKNCATLKIELWRMRADRVPMALSGRAGSDWRAFEDEAKRYCRYAPNYEPQENPLVYWREPNFPLQRNAKEIE